jgi:hypothetical protein
MEVMNRCQIEWTCQVCGKLTTEAEITREKATVRVMKLEDLAREKKRICSCGGKFPACDQCGACCSYYGYIYTRPDWFGFVREGHLDDFDGVEGSIKKRRKPWSKNYSVCIFLKKGEGCPHHLYGMDVQPSPCFDYSCKLPPASNDEKFKEFKDKWMADGMDKVVRNEEVI